MPFTNILKMNMNRKLRLRTVGGICNLCIHITMQLCGYTVAYYCDCTGECRCPILLLAQPRGFAITELCGYVLLQMCDYAITRSHNHNTTQSHTLAAVRLHAYKHVRLPFFATAKPHTCKPTHLHNRTVTHLHNYIFII